MRCMQYGVYKIQNIDNADDCHRETNYNYTNGPFSLCSRMHYIVETCDTQKYITNAQVCCGHN